MLKRVKVIDFIISKASPDRLNDALWNYRSEGGLLKHFMVRHSLSNGQYIRCDYHYGSKKRNFVIRPALRDSRPYEVHSQSGWYTPIEKLLNSHILYDDTQFFIEEYYAETLGKEVTNQLLGL